MHQGDRTELKYQIALTMVPAIGPVTARMLINHLGSAREVFQVKKKSLGNIRGIGPQISDSLHASSLLDQAERELDFLDRHRISAHYFKDPKFPQQLNHCSDGPILLYVKGGQDLNPARSLSIVGTRRASSYGRDLCRQIIKDLASMMPGLVIVSGLAYGIDVIAHRAALDYGLPTVAVLGHGLHTLYPSSHRDTAIKMLKHGALLSDFHSNMGPERNNFLRRNRIIAGISHGTLVVESAETGGALITATQALSYNRDVLAVPGRAGDPRSVGCNNLIKRNMAAMVTEAPDILHALNWEMEKDPHTDETPFIEMSPAEKKIMHLLGEQEGAIPETIGQFCGMDIPEVLVCLLEMELKGWIESEAGKRYRVLLPLPGTG